MKSISSPSTSERSPSKQLAHSMWPLKTSFSLPRPQWAQMFVADRLLRKSTRAAELAFWQATGGDFLRASHTS